MKILITSHFFSPSVGGIETCSKDLALGFQAAGHEVRVVTTTPSKNTEDDLGLTVIRQPSPKEFLKQVIWCSVFLQNNISLRMLWPLALVRRPLVVATHTWIRQPSGSRTWCDFFKIRFLWRKGNIYISQAVARHIGYPGTIVPNPYDDSVFTLNGEAGQRRGLIFVGRLVSDKGCALLLEALADMKKKGIMPTLSVVGSGPEETSLRQQAERLQLNGQVQFKGVLRGSELAAELNRHLVLVVPSLWEEPFGLVALEGIACGCIVVGSEGGGLPDAIGPCGSTFPNGDSSALATVIRTTLESPKLQVQSTAAAAGHLIKHSRAEVVKSYLKVLTTISDEWFASR